MTKNNELYAQEFYLAPECCIMSLHEDSAICETSYNGDIEPGQGIDWGII